MDSSVLHPAGWVDGAGAGIFHMSSGKAFAFPERFRRGCANLGNALNTKVISASIVSSKPGYSPGPPAATAKAFHELLAQEDVRLLISSIGGFNANSALPFIDWDLVRAQRKIICGYSDTTALLLATYKNSGISVVHGPAVMPQWGAVDGILPETARSFRNAIVRTGPSYLIKYAGYWIDPRSDWTPGREVELSSKPKYNQPWRSIRVGEAKGVILGGNVETINMLVGTPFLPDFAGAIAFVEATGAEAYLPRFHRALVHLRDSGVLSDISGLVVGRLLGQEEVSEVSLEDVLHDVFGGKSFPIVADVDLGHTEPMVSLPLGATGTLSATADEVAIRIEWTTR